MSKSKSTCPRMGNLPTTKRRRARWWMVGLNIIFLGPRLRSPKLALPCTAQALTSMMTATPPPLGTTGVLCSSKTVQISDRGTLHYTIYRPRMLQPITIPSSSFKHSPIHQPKPPLICVAGGPGIPAYYLISLVHLFPDRAVIIYDHLGAGKSCGSGVGGTALHRSSIIEGMVEELEAVVNDALPRKGNCSFHLLGHSLGGAVAFEFLKQRNTNITCRSIILANAPASIAMSHESRRELVAQIHRELQSKASDRTPGGEAASLVEAEYGDFAKEEDPDAAALWRAADRIFQERHECRVSPMPLVLHQSLMSLNSHIYTDAQYDELEQYMASSTDMDADQIDQLPPVLVLRGQYDFVSHDNAHAWVEIFSSCKNSCQYVTIPNSSHYGMVESEDLYGDAVCAFLRKHDG